MRDGAPMDISMTILMAGCLALADGAAKEGTAKKPFDIRDALRPANGLVGTWKGTARPLDRQSKRKRLFRRVKSQWEWSFAKDRTGLAWKIEGDKEFAGGLLTYDPKAQAFLLKAERPDGSKIEFVGALSKGQLDLDGPEDDKGQTRLTLRVVGEKRYLMYLSRRRKGSKRFVRTLQVGNTREGVRFATGAGDPECIVTGGLGTMKVTHAGKTYFVCCSGCRQAFEEDPEKYIAEAAKK